MRITILLCILLPGFAFSQQYVGKFTGSDGIMITGESGIKGFEKQVEVYQVLTSTSNTGTLVQFKLKSTQASLPFRIASLSGAKIALGEVTTVTLNMDGSSTIGEKMIWHNFTVEECIDQADGFTLIKLRPGKQEIKRPVKSSELPVKTPPVTIPTRRSNR